MSWIDWLRPALIDTTEDELIAALMAGKAQVWPGETAAMVTEVRDGAEGRFIHVWLAGGDLAGIAELRPGMEAWARAMGCRFATINGRPGWARFLRKAGFARVGDELRKSLHV